MNRPRPIVDIEKVDPAGSNDGDARYSRRLSIAPEGRGLAVFVTAGLLRRGSARVHDEDGAGLRLNVEEVRQLRDALDEWLSNGPS